MGGTRGVHFAAHEEPALLAADLTRFFRGPVHDASRRACRSLNA